MTSPDAQESRPSPLVGWMRAKYNEVAGDSNSTIGRARSRLSGVVLTAIAIVVGAAAAFLLVLLVWALPNVPSLIVGFAGGAIMGGALTLTLASRYPFLRKIGGFAILLAPLLVLFAPFLLIGAAFVLLRRTKPQPVEGAGDRIVIATPAPAKPRRRTARRRSS